MHCTCKKWCFSAKCWTFTCYGPINSLARVGHSSCKALMVLRYLGCLQKFNNPHTVRRGHMRSALQKSAALPTKSAVPHEAGM